MPCAVRFALVSSRRVRFIKVFIINSLHGLRATLDQRGAERRNVDPLAPEPRDPRSQDHIDPPDQSRPIERDQDDRGRRRRGNLKSETRPHLRIWTRSADPK